MHTRKSMLNIKGVSEGKVNKILEAAVKISPEFGFSTGSQVLERRSEVLKISTGSTALDQLLGGGIESMSITEAFGEYRTGKTQLCHTLCVTAQLPREHGGGNGKVAYLDTEGTFRPEKIKSIAERFGADPKEVLDNIIYSRVYTNDAQYEILSPLAGKLAEGGFSLIIIDSIMALFRVDYSGRGELAERQQKLGKVLSVLVKLAEQFNIAIFYTNIMTSDPGGGSMFISDPKKPIGGHVIAHASTTRLLLKKGRGEQRICKISHSPSLPESECVFSLSEQGISDATD